MEKLDQLENRISDLEKFYAPLFNQLKIALDLIKIEPASSLSKSRSILEILISDIYIIELNQSPDNKTLNDKIQDLSLSKKIKKNILARINYIRSQCNNAVHNEEVTKNDAIDVLENLCDVFEWYLKKYKSISTGRTGNSNSITYYSNSFLKFVERNLAIILVCMIVLIASEIIYVTFFNSGNNSSNSEVYINEIEKDKIIKNFIRDYQNTYKLNNIDSTIYFFDESFNFLGHKNFNKDSLYREAVKFFPKYPDRQSVIISEIIINKLNETIYQVSFDYNYQVKNDISGKTAKGNMRSKMKLVFRNGRPFITEVIEYKF